MKEDRIELRIEKLIKKQILQRAQDESRSLSNYIEKILLNHLTMENYPTLYNIKNFLIMKEKGEGELTYSSGKINTEFEVYQFANGKIILKTAFISSDKLQWISSDDIDEGFSLRGRLENGLSIRSEDMKLFRKNVIFPPGNWKGEFACWKGVSIGDSLDSFTNEHEVVFPLANFRYDFIQREPLDLGEMKILFFKLGNGPDYAEKIEFMKLTNLPLITSEMRVYHVKSFTEDEILKKIESVCFLLSLARGCDVWYPYYLIKMKEIVLRKVCLNIRISNPILGVELIDDNDLKDFIKQGYQKMIQENRLKVIIGLYLRAKYETYISIRLTLLFTCLDVFSQFCGSKKWSYDKKLKKLRDHYQIDLSKYGIDLDFNKIRELRNEIIHKGEYPPSTLKEVLENESKLTTFLEIGLLKALNYNGFFVNCARNFQRQQL